MAEAKQGDTVRVHYTGMLADGEVFDSSECIDDGCECPSGPLEFIVGSGQVIPGFENAVVGMQLGESKRIHIPMDEAYGDRMEELVGNIERSLLPAGLEPVVGGQLEVTREDGQVFPVLVTAVSETEVILDANHPLAGRDLTFDIRLVEIV